MVGRKKDDQIPMESNEQNPKKPSRFRRIRGLLTGESRKEKRARKQLELVAKNSSLGTEYTVNGANRSSHSPSSDDGRHYEDDESTLMGVVVDESASLSSGVFKRSFSNDAMKKASNHNSNHRMTDAVVDEASPLSSSMFKRPLSSDAMKKSSSHDYRITEAVFDESASRSPSVFKRRFSNDPLKKSSSHDSTYRKMGAIVDEYASRSTSVFKRRFSNDAMRKSSSHDTNHRNIETELMGGQNQNSFILKVVLLVMDPISRRFELLQLEFDSLKARVSDVLAQIPVAVTETSLRERNYMAITSADAQQLLPNRLLSDCCTGNEVLVAMPAASTTRECVKLARPILSDEKVVCMLQASGIDASAWKRVKKSKKKLNPSTPNQHSATSSDLHSNRDINVQDPIESTNIIQTPMQPMDGTTSVGGNINLTNESKMRSLLMKSLWLLPIAILVQVFYPYMSRSISPGNILAPDVRLSKCGLFGLVTFCDDAFFHVSKDGNAYCYDSHKKIAWQLEGTPCENDDTACIPGLQFTTEHKIMLGGKRVEFVHMVATDVTLSPWPFVVEPLLLPITSSSTSRYDKFMLYFSFLQLLIFWLLLM